MTESGQRIRFQSAGNQRMESLSHNFSQKNPKTDDESSSPKRLQGEMSKTHQVIPKTLIRYSSQSFGPTLKAQIKQFSEHKSLRIVKKNDEGVQKMFKKKKSKTNLLAKQDVEDVQNNLYNLKIETNTLLQDNIKLKTVNKNLESALNSCYEDLQLCQQELIKMQNGEPNSSYALSSSIIQGVKHLVRVERAKNKQLNQELETLKRSFKVTSQQEMLAQLEVFHQECVRLRRLVRNSVVKKPKKKDSSMQNEVEARAKSVLHKKEQELRNEAQKSKLLLEELELYKKGFKATSPNNDKQKDKELQSRLNLVVKQKTNQIKTLTDQLEECKEKLKNYDRVSKHNVDLTNKLIACKDQQTAQEIIIAELQAKLAAKPEKSPKNIYTGVQSRVYQEKSPKLHCANCKDILIKIQDSKSSNSLRSKNSFKMPQSSGSAQKMPEKISDFKLLEICLPGLIAQIQKKPEDPVYKQHQAQMNVLQKSVKWSSQNKENLQKVIDSNLNPNLPIPQLLEQLKNLIGKWDTIQMILTYYLPESEQDVQTMTDRIKKHLKERSVGLSFGVDEMIMRSESRHRSHYESDASFEQSQRDIAEVLEAHSRSISDANVQAPQILHTIPDRDSIALPSSQQSITENQMLNTAEEILNRLAKILIESGWTAHDVFGQPAEILEVIPFYEEEHNVLMISARNFLGRVYQVGIQDLTHFQVACLMRVLGKPDLQDSVKYKELELLLYNFGVVKSGKENEYFNYTIHDERDEDNIGESSAEVIQEEVVFIEDPGFQSLKQNDLMLIFNLFFFEADALLQVPKSMTKQQSLIEKLNQRMSSSRSIQSFQRTLFNGIKFSTVEKIFFGYSRPNSLANTQLITDLYFTQSTKPYVKKSSIKIVADLFLKSAVCEQDINLVANLFLAKSKQVSIQDQIMVANLFMEPRFTPTFKTNQFHQKIVSERDQILIANLFMDFGNNGVKQPASKKHQIMVANLFMEPQFASKKRKPAASIKDQIIVANLFMQPKFKPTFATNSKPIVSLTDQMIVADLFMENKQKPIVSNRDITLVSNLFFAKDYVADPAGVQDFVDKAKQEYGFRVKTPSKSSRNLQSHQLFNDQKINNVIKVFDQVFQQKPIIEFLKVLDEQSSKTIVKSKTKKSETKVISQSAFSQVVSRYAINKLTEQDFDLIRPCIILSQKIKDVYELMHLNEFLLLLALKIKNTKKPQILSQDAQSILNLFFDYGKPKNAQIKDQIKISDLYFTNNDTAQRTVKQSNLSVDCQQKIRRVFEIFDIDHTDTIDKNEAFKHFKGSFSKLSAKEFFKQVDANQDGSISYQEFTNFWSLVKATGRSEAEIMEELDRIEKGEGWTGFNDVKKVEYDEIDETAANHAIDLFFAGQKHHQVKPKDIEVVIDLFLFETKSVVRGNDLGLVSDLFLIKSDDDVDLNLVQKIGTTDQIKSKDASTLIDLFFEKGKNKQVKPQDFAQVYDLFIQNTKDNVNLKLVSKMAMALKRMHNKNKISQQQANTTISLFFNYGQPKIPLVKDQINIQDLFFTKDNTVNAYYAVKQSNLSVDCQRKIRRVFEIFDIDHTDTIDKNEAFNHFKGTFSKLSAKEFFKQIDANQDGSISYQEFTNFWSLVKATGRSEAKIMEELDRVEKGEGWTGFNDIKKFKYDEIDETSANHAIQIFFGGNNKQSVKPNDMVLVQELFLFETKVVNLKLVNKMAYSLKQRLMNMISKENANQILDLFFSNKQKKSVVEGKDLGLVCDLFLIKSDDDVDLNLVSKIGTTEQIKSQDASNLIDLFFQKGKNKQVKAQDLAKVYDLFLYNTKDTVNLKLVSKMAMALRKKFDKNQLKEQDSYTAISLMFDYGKPKTLEPNNLTRVIDLFFLEDQVTNQSINSEKANQVIALFLGYGKPKNHHINDQLKISNLFFTREILKQKDLALVCDLFLIKADDQIDLNLVSKIGIGDQITSLGANTVIDLFFEKGKNKQVKPQDFAQVYDLFLLKTKDTVNLKLVSKMAMALKRMHNKNKINQQEANTTISLMFDYGKPKFIPPNDLKRVTDLFFVDDKGKISQQGISSDIANHVISLFFGYGNPLKPKIDEIKKISELFLHMSKELSEKDINFIAQLFFSQPQIQKEVMYNLEEGKKSEDEHKIHLHHAALIVDLFFGLSQQNLQLVSDLFFVDEQISKVKTPKTSRKDISVHLYNSEKGTNLVKMYQAVFSNMNLEQLIKQIEQDAYKQIIKSKTRTVETLVVKRDFVVKVLQKYHEQQLTEQDIHQIDQCAQLTQKDPSLYAMKHVVVMLTEAMANFKRKKVI